MMVDELINFEKDNIKKIAANLWRPEGRVTLPNPNATLGKTTPTPISFKIAKSQKILVTATKLLQYYKK